MSKKLTPVEALEEIKKYSKVVANSEEIKIIENALCENTILKYWLEGVIYYSENSSFTLLSLVKSIKALEIIKDCCIVAEYPTLEEENKYELAFCNKICISKEEYDLLKEVLK